MRDQGIHVEFTMTGISWDIFASILEWIGDGLQPFFPIVSGAWGMFETAAFTITMIGTGLAALVMRALLGDRSTESDTTNVIAGVPELRDATAQEPAPLRNSLAATLPGAQYAAAVTAAIVTCRATSFISRVGLYYVAGSLIICWIFGTGDLGVLAAFGMGG